MGAGLRKSARSGAAGESSSPASRPEQLPSSSASPGSTVSPKTRSGDGEPSSRPSPLAKTSHPSAPTHHPAQLTRHARHAPRERMSGTQRATSVPRQNARNAAVERIRRGSAGSFSREGIAAKFPSRGRPGKRPTTLRNPIPLWPSRFHGFDTPPSPLSLWKSPTLTPEAPSANPGLDFKSMQTKGLPRCTKNWSIRVNPPSFRLRELSQGVFPQTFPQLLRMAPC